MAHIAKYNKDRLDIDIKCTVNKLFCHFSSSAKRTELKIIFELVDEEYHSLLLIWPAVTRVHACWPAVKAYFLSLGGTVSKVSVEAV